ncbi:Vacuolar protein-sorting-associated protein 28 [Nowakowskiella sp. JEL0407]|nr:Vacuolar protein-sorting-associated protein 28 [Nowakowskiella sp. JEL0407]
MWQDSSLDQEIKLYANNNKHDREKYENMADLYSIIVATDYLEKAYLRDLISAQEYTPVCNKLIGQYKAAMNLLRDSVPDIHTFMREYNLTCTAAERRLVEIGVPATVEHTIETGTVSQKHIAEVTQYFITLMDALKLNMIDMDQIHPQLSDLLVSLNKVTTLPADMEGKKKIKEWLVTLNQMKASDALSADQVRQLEFDMSRANDEFYRLLK